MAIFEVIAGCDPTDPVTAASQGERADSYLRFLDKDGARGARPGVVHQLFTSEAAADPRAMTRIPNCATRLEHRLREAGAGGSNPLTPTIYINWSDHIYTRVM